MKQNLISEKDLVKMPRTFWCVIIIIIFFVG